MKGILFLPLSTLRVSFPALSNPANNHRAVPLTAEQFHYAFTNNLSEPESLAVYERYAVPGPDHVLFQAAFANFKLYGKSKAITEYKNFPGRTHYTLGQDGWRESCGLRANVGREQGSEAGGGSK